MFILGVECFAKGQGCAGKGRLVPPLQAQLFSPASDAAINPRGVQGRGGSNVACCSAQGAATVLAAALTLTTPPSTKQGRPHCPPCQPPQRRDDRAAEKDAMLAAASLKLQLSQLLLTDMLTMRRNGVFNWKKHYDHAVTLCGQVGGLLVSRFDSLN